MRRAASPGAFINLLLRGLAVFLLLNHADLLPAIDQQIGAGEMGHRDVAHQKRELQVADARLEVIVSPGHTPGSVCLYCEELGVVFSGDTLLASGPGRYCGEFPNFPAQLTAVGEYLLTLPPRTRVLPS